MSPKFFAKRIAVIVIKILKNVEVVIDLDTYQKLQDDRPDTTK